MKTVGAFEAKTQFSALIKAAEHGESTVVTKNGKPVARIVPFEEDSGAKEAMEFILSRKQTLGAPIREFIEEGRRY
jgi:prevent-host-death family protein